MSREVFDAVAADSAARRGYSRELHERVDTLIEEWLSGNGGRTAPAGANGFEEQVRECRAWVSTRYREEFGIPVIGWLLWPMISGLISWLVRRTLERMFPRGSDGAGLSAQF